MLEVPDAYYLNPFNSGIMTYTLLPPLVYWHVCVYEYTCVSKAKIIELGHNYFPPKPDSKFLWVAITYANSGTKGSSDNIPVGGHHINSYALLVKKEYGNYLVQWE